MKGDDLGSHVGFMTISQSSNYPLASDFFFYLNLGKTTDTILSGSSVCHHSTVLQAKTVMSDLEQTRIQ